MRNSFIFLLFFIAAAQSCKRIEEVTATAGAGGSSIEGGSYTDPLGMQVSIEAKIIEVNKKSSFSAGIGYSRQGANYKDPDYSGTVTTSYINLPLLYTYQSDKGFYGEIGLQPSFLLSGRDKGITSFTFAYEYDDDYKDSLNKFDLGIPVGIGYQFKNGLGIGARAVYGLLNVEKGNDYATHNLLVVGLLRYRFNFQKKK